MKIGLIINMDGVELVLRILMAPLGLVIITRIKIQLRGSKNLRLLIKALQNNICIEIVLPWSPTAHCSKVAGSTICVISPIRVVQLYSSWLFIVTCWSRQYGFILDEPHWYQQGSNLGSLNLNLIELPSELTRHWVYCVLNNNTFKLFLKEHKFW